MINKTAPSTQKTIPPFEITQALIGLGLDDADNTIITYTDFLNRVIPIGAAFFIHVLPKFNLLTAMYEKDTQALIGNYSLDEDMINRMEEKVNALLKTKDDLYVEYDIREGDPLDTMLNCIDDFKADLLIVGQQKGKEHHGILAKNLARNTTGNALIIPQDAQPRISKILVPIDFSQNSAEALKAAIGIQQQMKTPCQIVCLNIYSFATIKNFRMDRSWIQTISVVENNIRDTFNTFLETNAGDYKDQIETVLIEKESNNTAQFIVDYANQNEFDFMVMGAKGHSKVRLMLLGSVTEAVLDKNNRIPTLIIR